MMKAKTHQNKFLRIITTPFRALAKARDLYVRSMNSYADKAYYGSSGLGGVSYADPLPRSFSSNLMRSRESDDFKELVRVASTSSLGKRVDLGSVLSSANNNVATSSSSGTLLLKQEREKMGGFKGVSRSASVGMAKIEEDKPCEFDDDNIDEIGHFGVNNKSGVSSTKQKMKLFPRSRSYAVGATMRNASVLQ